MPKPARKSASPTPTPSKPRTRSDVSAKAGKAKVADKAPAPSKAKPKAAPRKHGAAAALATKAKTPVNQTSGEDLAPKVRLFCEHYLVDLNATQAYLKSYPGAKYTTASVEGCKLLGNPKVQAFISAERQKTTAKLEIKRETVLQEAWNVATADARELTEWRVGCCRYCYGEGNQYQRTVGEMERDREAHAAAVREAIRAGEPAPGPFNEKGGIGWNPRLDPNPDCQECFGEGQGRHIMKDTSKLSSAAVSLYAGVKVTKDGLQVLTHSKQDASEKLFKHLGLYEKDNSQKGQGLAELVAGFAAGLHQRAAGRLPIAPPKKGDAS